MKSITLNIGGEDRVFYFGLGFLGNLLEATDTNMVDFDRLRAANPFKWVPLMMFHSLAYGYSKNSKEVDFTLQNVIDWIDETELDVLVKFNTAFAQSLTKDVPEDKKKVTGKKAK